MGKSHCPGMPENSTIKGQTLMNSEINSILVPTDFSPLSECALNVAVAIATRQNAEIDILHVIGESNYLPPSDIFLPDVRVTDDIATTIGDLLVDYSEKLQNDTGIKVNGKILFGIPSDQICQYAKLNSSSLIVMGTHGVTGFREFIIGSEAYNVVKYAQCPVLTVPGNWNRTEFKKILFPIRLVPGANEKYSFIQPIIKKNNAELFILGLQEKESPDKISELVLLMIELKLQLHNDNISFESIICPSEDFSSSVIETAENRDVDLVVITADIEYGFASFFTGTYERQVINHSRLPVLCVKPTERKLDPTLYLKLALNWRKSSMK
jgi:nucleotide-binding universal stress UspA family protein